MDTTEDIYVDPLFVGLTRPATLWGVPYSALIIEVTLIMSLFIMAGNIFILTAVLPIHGILYLITLYDPGIFSTIQAWALTETRCRNRKFWGATSFSPKKFPKEKAKMLSDLPFFGFLKKEEPIETFIPYTTQITPHIVKLESGDYLQILRLEGAAHESADILDINTWHGQLNGYLRNIASPKMAVWSQIVRREIKQYPDGSFEKGFCHDFNEKYRQSLNGQTMRVNELFVTLVYRPKPFLAFNLVDYLFDSFSKTDAQEKARNEKEDIERFNELVISSLMSLERYSPTRLSLYEHNGQMFSEVLEYLSYLVNCEWRRFPLCRSLIKEVIGTSRPFFGRGGLMAQKTPTETIFSGIITIQEYPKRTCPGILNQLLSMPFDFVLTQSMTFLTKQAALSNMQQQKARLIATEDGATSQIEEIDEAIDMLISNEIVMGTHSYSLMILSDDPKKLNESIADAGAALSDCGMVWLREDIGMSGAFWAQLPGNFKYRIRSGDISSRNFAALSAFHNYPQGKFSGSQWGPCVAMFKTASGGPYFFNFHK